VKKKGTGKNATQWTPQSGCDEKEPGDDKRELNAECVEDRMMNDE
jgi:hypothetical protein